jgi:hypothetical protein
MNQAEYDNFIKAKQASRYLRGCDLQNKTPRTLIYGYTCDRHTFHVYLDGNGLLNRVIYDSDRFLVSHADESAALEASNYSPEKRAYPEACDLEFCQLLSQSGVEIPFTAFSEDRKAADWYGLRLEELTVVEPNDCLGVISLSVQDMGLKEDVSHLSDKQIASLESKVSAMLTEVFGGVYRRAKYLNSDELPKWIASLPGNIEWSVRDWFKTMGYVEYKSSYAEREEGFTLDPAVAVSLQDKVMALMLAKLSPVPN